MVIVKVITSFKNLNYYYSIKEIFSFNFEQSIIAIIINPKRIMTKLIIIIKVAISFFIRHKHYYLYYFTITRNYYY